MLGTRILSMTALPATHFLATFGVVPTAALSGTLAAFVDSSCGTASDDFLSSFSHPGSKTFGRTADGGDAPDTDEFNSGESDLSGTLEVLCLGFGLTALFAIGGLLIYVWRRRSFGTADGKDSGSCECGELAFEDNVQTVVSERLGLTIAFGGTAWEGSPAALFSTEREVTPLTGFDGGGLWA
jgi:hypothetical protein